MSADNLRVLIDTAQPRLSSDRLALSVKGNDWDDTSLVNVYHDRVTETLFLMPLPMSPQWNQNHTGDYARLKKSDFTFATPSAWVESDRMDSGHSNYLHSQGVVESAITTQTFSADTPMYLSYFAPGTGADKQIDLEFGWANTALKSDPGPSVSVRVWSDGLTEVWKNGKIVWSGSIAGDKSAQSTDLQTVNLYCIPFRQRELLILSNQGTGFSAVFEDIAEDDFTTPILPSTKFWFKFYGDATIELAPIRVFKTGSAVSKQLALAEPVESPPDDIVQFSGGPVQATLSLVDADDPTTAFASGQRCRLKADFSGNGVTTPVLFAAEVVYDGEVALTSDSPTDITAYVKECVIDVGDDPSGVTASLTFESPKEIESEVIGNFLTLSNRPVEIYVGSRRIFTGRTNAPDYILSPTDFTSKATITVRDHWKALETYFYSDPKALDGYQLTDAFAWVVKSAGFEDDDLDLPADMGFALPKVGTQSADFNVLINVFDTPAEWAKRLHETYASRHLIGFGPEGVFRLADPDDTVGATVKLCSTFDSALLQVGGSPGASTYDQKNRARKRVFRKFRSAKLEAAANYVCVIGHDPRLDAPIRSVNVDYESADPSTPPNGRPDNWLGELRKFGYADSTITTQDAADFACQTIYERLTRVGEVCEFECELLIDDADKLVWKGDVVELEGYGRYRITSFHGSLSAEASDAPHDMTSRPFTYTAERIGDGFTE